jgi:7,8-dihydropterin-6-yl-methyl-4-(beta-D-ribofuranosyl)aminobenzene 5'-phosphate synthase
MKAKVLSVYDEGSLERTSLIGARGLSILIDVDGERTLFDTGMRGNYLMHNLDILGADPNAVDRIVISHAHKEHAGGLQQFLERREKSIDVLTTSDRIDMTRRFLGIQIGKDGGSAETSPKMNVVAVSEWTKLSENLFITGKIPDGGSETIGENSLVLMTKNGPAVICGCCHGGLGRTLSFVGEMTGRKVTAVIGGTHMLRMRRKQVHEVAEMLKDNGPPSLYLNHCTGHTQRTYLREKLGLNAVKEFYVGTEIRFDV